MKIVGILFVMFVMFGVASPAKSAETEKPASVSAPHFASLRSNEVNMRTGPGTRYPIEWVYKRKGLPVEVIGEFEIWRHVRDSDGSEGWVHKSALVGKRMAIVTGAPRNLLEDNVNGASVSAHLENGAIGQILSCTKDWCRLKFDGIKGYLRKSEFWGSTSDEVLN